MIKVTSIRACDSGDGVMLSVNIDGEKNTFDISADDFLESGIVKGVITADDFDKLSENSRFYAAKRAAIRIIASGQCSKKKLYEKLRRKGFPHQCAKNAADYAADCGYIDEEWQIKSYLKDLVGKRYIGRRKLLPMLLAKGYSGDKILSVLDESYTDEEFRVAKQSFLIKKFGKTKPENFEEAEEMKKALYKQGY